MLFRSGARLRAHIAWPEIPFIAQALDHVKAGVFTGASTRNWAGYGKEIELPPGMKKWQEQLLTDPQTSGGLLVACSPDAESSVLEVFASHGFRDARTIGEFTAGSPGVSVSLT